MLNVLIKDSGAAYNKRILGLDRVADARQFDLATLMLIQLSGQCFEGLA
jgi:hypothetical protein